MLTKEDVLYMNPLLKTLKNIIEFLKKKEKD